jgi:Zn-dependent protease
MVIVAAAGPGVNVLLALVSGLLLALVGSEEQSFLARLFSYSIFWNAIIAVFNMIPLPPLDGGRIAVGLLPGTLAYPLARLEPLGLWIIIGLFFILPLVTAQLGFEINPFASVIWPAILWVVDTVMSLTGATRLQL